jgi:hypothetical protein
MISIVYVIATLLLLFANANDIHPNPGPQNWKSTYLCHINIRSLSVRKKLEIENSLKDKCDIITLSETFFNNKTTINDYAITGFKPIECLNRSSGTGGGVAVYVKNHIIALRRRDLEVDNLEAMWVELRIFNNKLLVCVCYRPPGSGVEFWDLLRDSVDNAKLTRIQNIVITGDLNSDPTTFHGEKLERFVNSNNMYMHIHEPTRITATSSTILDQIISNNPRLVTSTWIEPPISTNDHCTVFGELQLKTKKDPPYYRLMWQFSRADREGLLNYMDNLDWNECFISEDVNEVSNLWTAKLLSAAKLFIPHKLVMVRPYDKPFYSSHLRNMKRNVLRAFKKAKRLGYEVLWDRYHELNNKYHDEVNLAKENYDKKRNISLRDNSAKSKKTWWKTVKQLLGFSKDSSIPSLVDGTSVVTDNKGKAELLNNFFTSHSNVDTSGANLPDNMHVPQQTISTVILNEKEVVDIIQSLDPEKAIGPDGVSPKLLKICAPMIAPSLTKLFNLSLKTCKFPNSWKFANVMPIFKKGDTSDVNNYRPVSLLSCLSKVFEKAIFKHVFNFLRENLVISIHQSGFLPGDSTINQLVNLYHTFSKALDDKKDVHIVFCDISKAFDRVWHDGLLYKLKKVGISGDLLHWFNDYLKNRKQKVVLNGQASTYSDIRAGVPQGSVLGPLLFLIYINDIVDNVNGNIKLFADDTVLFIDVDKDDTAKEVLQQDLQALLDWSNQWLVKFNSTKTVQMKMSLKKCVTIPELLMGNSKLENMESHKHLGLTISNNLSWKKHINNICIRANRQLDIMKRLKYSVDRRTLEIVYFSFIRPLLEYGSVIWDNCDQIDATLIENVQLDAGRVVSGAIRGTSHDAIYRELGWEPLKIRRERQQILLFHKMIYGQCPEYLIQLVPGRGTNLHNYNTRNQTNLLTMRCRTEQYRQSFIPKLVRLWNLLPKETTSIDDFSMFKRVLMQNKPKANLLYYEGDRKSNVIQARMRMGCSALKYHLFYNIHVVDSPMCICSMEEETVEHYFFRCPLFVRNRIKLILNIMQHTDIENLDNINTELVLNGDSNMSILMNERVFEEVQLFIRETERFEI